jgi:short-subunit dehydrogenase
MCFIEWGPPYEARGSVGAEIGVPFLANDGGAKAYIHSLGEALHYEFKPRGVYVTVVPPPLTNTAVLAKLGFDPRGPCR